VVDDRTDETSGRDEKDVGVHSCNCGVAEKKRAARMAHAYRGANSREDRNPILYGMARYWAALVQEWYYVLPELSSNNSMLGCGTPYVQISNYRLRVEREVTGVVKTVDNLARSL
jgi:hypothetical protein